MSTFLTLPSVFEVLAGVGFVLLIIWALSWWKSRSLTDFRSRRSTRMWAAAPLQACDLAKAHAQWKLQRAHVRSTDIPANETPSDIQTQRTSH